MNIAFIFESTLTVGDHEGYCTDNECDEETLVDYIAFTIEVPTKLIIDDNMFKQCYNYFGKQFRGLEGSIENNGSNYCELSHRHKLQHEYFFHLKLHKIVRENDFNGYDNVKVIDNNSSDIRQFPWKPQYYFYIITCIQKYIITLLM